MITVKKHYLHNAWFFSLFNIKRRNTKNNFEMQTQNKSSECLCIKKPDILTTRAAFYTKLN